MRLDLSEESVLRAGDTLELLFPEKKSRMVAGILVKFLRENRCQASKNAISSLADQLNEGGFFLPGQDAPLKYSRNNFYKTVVRRLVSLGFLRTNVPVWDEIGRRTLYVYAVNIFDIPQKPPSIGFWRLAYYISKKWNKMFS